MRAMEAQTWEPLWRPFTMRRTLVALALTFSLSVPSSSPFDRLWTLLSSFLSPTVEAPTAENKLGCGMDPNGQCQPALRQPLDIGCGMDPDGTLCQPGS